MPPLETSLDATLEVTLVVSIVVLPRTSFLSCLIGGFFKVFKVGTFKNVDFDRVNIGGLSLV